MDSGSEDNRTTKRQRVMGAMGMPDGFSKPASKSKKIPVKSLHKVQDFASAFEEPTRAGPSKPPSKTTIEMKPLNVKASQLQMDTFGALNGSSTAHRRPGTVKRSLPTTVLRPQFAAQSSSSNPMRFNPSSVKGPEIDSLNPTSKGLTMLQRPVLKKAAPIITDDPSLKRLTVPPPISLGISKERTSKKPVLKSMAPPPLLPPKTPPKAPSKSLRTINTTRMALATDPTSSDGAAELLSLFLQDHKEIVPAKPDADAERNRGIDISPEKKGKSGVKFIRGGLAEQAKHIFSIAHTSISLWQRELEHLYRTSPNALAPDLRLRITQIFHSPSPNPKNYCGLAECAFPVDETTVNWDNSPSEGPTPTPFFVSRSFGRDTQPRLVLFSFVPPPLAYSADLGIRTATRFAIGREVLLWRPWQEVEVAFPETTNVAQHMAGGEGRPQAKNVIFCSRFMITNSVVPV